MKLDNKTSREKQNHEDEIDRKIRLSDCAQKLAPVDDVFLRECVCEAYLRECRQPIDDGCELRQQVSCTKARRSVGLRKEHCAQQSTTFPGGGGKAFARKEKNPNRPLIKSDAKTPEVDVPREACHASCKPKDVAETAIEDCCTTHKCPDSLLALPPVLKLKHLNLSGCFQVTDVGIR